MMTMVLLVVIILFVVGMLVFFHRRTKAQLETFTSEMGVAELRSGVLYEGEYSGQKYHYKYVEGNKRPASFEVSLDCESNGEFQITRESDSDVYYKRIGISAEIQTGDLPFDDACYIQTDSVAFTKRFFESAEKRAAVLRLLELSFEHIRHDGETMAAVKSPLLIAEGGDKRTIDSVVTELAIVASNPPENHPETLFIEAPVLKFKRIGVTLMSLASVLIGFALILWAPIAFTPLDKGAVFIGSLIYSLPAFLIFMIASVFMLKGRSTSHHELIANFFIALLGFPMFGYGATVALNGYLDEAEPRFHNAAILDKRISKSSKSTRYYVELKSWRAGRKREKIKVNSRSYDRMDVGMALQVTTLPGKFGYEWLADHSLIER